MTMHFIERCECGVVLSQCRRPGPKTERISTPCRCVIGPSEDYKRQAFWDDFLTLSKVLGMRVEMVAERAELVVYTGWTCDDEGVYAPIDAVELER